MDTNYIAFSAEAIKEMFVTIYSNIGPIFNIALYSFFMLLGLFACIEILRIMFK